MPFTSCSLFQTEDWKSAGVENSRAYNNWVLHCMLMTQSVYQWKYLMWVEIGSIIIGLFLMGYFFPQELKFNANTILFLWNACCAILWQWSTYICENLCLYPFVLLIQYFRHNIWDKKWTKKERPEEKREGTLLLLFILMQLLQM